MATRGLFGGQGPQYTLPSDTGNVGQQLEVTANGVEWVDAAPYPGYGLPDPIGTPGQTLQVDGLGTGLEYVTNIPEPAYVTIPGAIRDQSDNTRATIEVSYKRVPLSQTNDMIHVVFGSGVFTSAPLSTTLASIFMGPDVLPAPVGLASGSAAFFEPTAFYLGGTVYGAFAVLQVSGARVNLTFPTAYPNTSNLIFTAFTMSYPSPVL